MLIEEFGEQTARAAHGWAKRGRILRDILYGDQARRDLGEGEDMNVRYTVLAVVNDARLADRAEYWATAEERLLRDAIVNEALSARVRLLVRCLSEMTDASDPQLSLADIAASGIALYEVAGFVPAR